MNAKRPSPSDSATLFSVGTKKIGSDGNYWTVILTKNNTKRWKKESSKLPKSVKKPKSVKTKSRKSKSKKAKSVKRKSKKSKLVKTKSHKSKSKKAKSVKRKSKKVKSVKRKSKKTKSKSKKTKSVKRKSKKVKSVKRKSKKTKSKSKKTKSVKRKSKKTKSKSKKTKSVKRKSKKAKSKSVKRKSESVKQESIKSFNKNTFSTMLANKYTGADPTGYFISEKLDGYRALFYNGPNGGEFFSRNNKPFVAPQWFLDDIASHLPAGTLLDGELYTKRGDFDSMGIVRKKIPVDSEWRKITFMVFDLPLVHKPFKERYQIMQTLLKDVPHVKLVEHIEVKSIEQFNTLHKKWVSQGGEGSMLRHPDSYYENKRSSMLLKVKDFMDDEAIVEGMEFGEGRNEGRLGALHVKWLDPKMGTNEFKVGSGFTDTDRKAYKTLFPIGTIITIKYFEQDKYSKKPRFPTYWRIYKNK
jgi:DNA ligase-1